MDEYGFLIALCWEVVETYESYLLDEATNKDLAAVMMRLLEELPEDMGK
tara:strand:+ start:833 stop:979 length:147 start_codon:yes stop_codon:yes gene_type:complete